MAILSSDKLVVVKAFAPGNPLPLDAREIYESLAEAKAYAASSAVAYAGQTIKVVEAGAVTSYNLVPSDVEGENYALQFVGGGGSGVQGISASNVAGNVAVVTVEGDHTVTKDVPVVGAFVDVAVTADTETESEKTEFTYKDASNVEQKKAVHATGVRKVEAGSVADKIKVTNAGADGALTSTEILIGAGSVKNPTYDAESRKITLPVLQADGTTQALEISLGKDMVVTSGAFNADDNTIDLTLTDGSVVKIPAASLIDVYTGEATATVTVNVSDTNVVTASVKVSTVEGNLLKTDENGLYVSEADFTATKQLIVDAEAAAKSHADTEIGKAKTELQGYADQAEADAKTYADEKIALEVTARDSAISTAVGNEATARDQAIAAAKTELQGYADQAEADALTDAKAYTDEQLEAAGTSNTEALDALKTELQTYADTAEADAVKSANSYTDTSIGTEVTNRNKAIEDAVAAEVTARDEAIAAAKTELQGYADTAEADAKKYTDDQLAAAKTELQTYADTAEADAKKYTDEQLAAADTSNTEALNALKTELQGYADQAEADAITSANGYTDTEIGELKTELQGYADQAEADALADAKAYTDEKVGAEATARGEAITAVTRLANAAQTHSEGVAADLATETQARKDADDAQVERIAALEGQITGLSGAMHFKGVEDAVPEDVSSYVEGDVIIVGEKEYVFNGTEFKLFGDVSAEGARLTALEGRADTVEGKVSTLEGEMDAVEAAVAKKVEQSVYDAKVAELANADSGLDTRLQAVEAQLGTGEGSVDEKIAAAKQEAIEAAAADATTKADAAEADAIASANGYTDEKIGAEVTARDGAIATAKSELQTYADTAEADAKAYADTEIGKAKTELQGYADTAEADAITSANGYTDTEIGEAKTELQGYADQAEADAIATANAYTDAAVAAAGIQWVDFGA